MISAILANPLLGVVIILGIVVITLLALVIILWMKMRRFLIGIQAESIKGSLDFVSENIRDVQQFRKDMEDYLTSVETRLKKSVQAVHTVRFNPFHGGGGGGNQSFATAFLSEEGDGVVISSLFARDHTSVYAKPVKKHTSEHELSDEEREAIAHAKTKLGI